MIKKSLLLLSSVLFTYAISAQDLKAYQLYNKNNQATTFQEMIKSLSDYDVVLFGEHHNNSIVHWLELKTEKALYALKGDKLILGAEMFERDNQEALDKYLEGAIDAKEFAKEARLWPNHNTDYKPLVDFAKENKLKFIATNVPRRYASMVAKGSLDTLNILPEDEKKFIAKLPIKVDMATPGYKEMITMMPEHSGDRAMNFVAAQAIKDATMAESILDNLKRKQLLLHFEGDYHSKEYGGIYWYLKAAKKKLKVAVISIFESDNDDLPMPDDAVLTDFNLVVPADITKTY
ncbi:MAG: ChaN family lipoprotein [Chitinophagaceae bacterium]|nr:ChaN family lipoprotein [Chitinophagaceae bacterium]